MVCAMRSLSEVDMATVVDLLENPDKLFSGPILAQVWIVTYPSKGA